MIEDEEQPQLLNTIGEYPTEEVGTIEEDIYVLGVESLNGKTGDLSIKTINGEDLVEEGNIDLQTPLDDGQMAAVNSGIDAEKVGQIATNAQNITTLQNTKQDNLTQTQLNAVNSGIDQTKVAQIATNTGNITSNTNRITTIEGKIPSAASSSNQLTDKNYVDNSIATNTANYISDNGQPFQSLADLEAYSGPLTNNDYAFVVSTDSAGNLLYTRYKYNADQELWAEEYTIANPTFTSTQWAAIDSGVTANDVTQIGTNKSDIANLQSGKQDALSQTQLDAVNSGIDATKVQQIATNAGNITSLQTDKQDKLIAGTNIQIAADGKTISATDTTYSAGTGLTLAGTQFSVTEPVPSGFFTDTAATQEGTGTTITLNNTVNAPIDNAELKGDTFQQTYSGINLLPPPADFNDTLGTLNVSCSKGVWTFSGTSQSGYTQSSKSVVAPYTIQAGDYFHYNNTLVSQRINIALTFTDSTTFASSMNVANRIVSLEDYVGKTISTVKANFNTGYEFEGTAAPMIVNNVSTQTEWQPYVGGIPSPNPSYPQDIQVVTGEQTVVVAGKNLFITDWEQGAVSSSGGQNAPDSNTVRTKGYIPVKPNQHYAINRSITTSYNNVRCYDKNKNYLGGGSAGIDFISGQGTSNASNPMKAGNSSCVISPKAGTYYIRFNDYSNDTSTKYMMVEGDTQATYEPYQAQTYLISLGSIELCKIGTYQDYIWKDGSDWKIHKEFGKLVLTGSQDEEWTISNSGTVNFFYRYRYINDAVQNRDYYICDRFSYANVSSNNTDEGFMIININQMRFRWGTEMTTDNLRTWLASNNVSVYYALATATDTQITDATLIAQLEALASSTTYSPQTNYSVLTPTPNLPAILTVDVFKNNYAGLLARLESAGA